MITKTRITLAATVAALALSVTSAAASAAPTGSLGASSAGSACSVQHGPWYNSGTNRVVDVYNECYGDRWVCVGIDYYADQGPYKVGARKARTLWYGIWPEPEGDSLYIAASTTSC